MANFKNQNHIPIEKKTKTYLPDDLVETIFTFLPIKDAIVIGETVSPKYKRSWRQNRRFVFGRDLFEQYDQQNLVAIVDHLFNSHIEGCEIKTFKLHIDPIGVEFFLKKWLQICARKDLEDLDLHFSHPGFTIEFSVFNSLYKLKTLKLIKCAIQLPEAPIGLQFLQKLSLCYIHLTEKMFHVLIEHCKMLEIIDVLNCSTIKKLNLIARENKHLKKLRIAFCNDLEEIEIDSSTLRSIFYEGNFVTVRIAQAMQLYEAFFHFATASETYIKYTWVEALVKDISNVSILTTTPLLIEGVAARIRDGVFREAQYCFANMRELQLIMDCGVFINPYDITMFLKNCPFLEKLFIDLTYYQFDLGMYWQMHQKPLLDNNINDKFTQLKVVQLRSFKFLPSELELVKIILQRATILESLFLIPPKMKSRSKYKREDIPKYVNLFGSWSASPTVRIKYCEIYIEKSFVNPTHPKEWVIDARMLSL